MPGKVPDQVCILTMPAIAVYCRAVPGSGTKADPDHRCMEFLTPYAASGRSRNPADSSTTGYLQVHYAGPHPLRQGRTQDPSPRARGSS